MAKGAGADHRKQLRNGQTGNVPLLDQPIDFDDELTRQALAADPDVTLGPDAVALPDPRQAGDGLLPAWYMPPPAVTSPERRRWRTAVVLLLVVALLLINALGFCITYGRLTVG